MEGCSQRIGRESTKKNSQEIRQMKETIGNAAGVIWKFLDQQPGPVNLSALKSGVSLPSTFLMMGLGWLAREGKLAIELSEASNSYKISLKR